jgi:hypothetical protein
MSTPRTLEGPARTAALGFLGLMATAAVIALASHGGLVGVALARRALGLVVGATALVTGNLLPKLRPLRGLGDPAEALRAERLAGWLLVLTGLGQLGLFALAPLGLARPLAAIAGAGALLAIAGHWTWLALASWLGVGRPRSARAAPPSEARKVAASLLFAVAQVLATACVTPLAGDGAWGARLTSWMAVGFWGLSALVFVALGCERASR